MNERQLLAYILGILTNPQIAVNVQGVPCLSYPKETVEKVVSLINETFAGGEPQP